MHIMSNETFDRRERLAKMREEARKNQGTTGIRSRFADASTGSVSADLESIDKEISVNEESSNAKEIVSPEPASIVDDEIVAVEEHTEIVAEEVVPVEAVVTEMPVQAEALVEPAVEIKESDEPKKI
jgi:hypothetical protein